MPWSFPWGTSFNLIRPNEIEENQSAQLDVLKNTFSSINSELTLFQYMWRIAQLTKTFEKSGMTIQLLFCVLIYQKLFEEFLVIF